MKLQYKLALIMFAFGSALLIAISFSYYFHTRSVTLENSHYSLQRIAEKTARHVEIHLEEKAKISIAHSNTHAITQGLTLSNSEFATLTEVERQQKIARLNKRWMETKDVTDPFIQTYMTNLVANNLRKQQEKIPKEYGEIFLTNRYGVIIATTNKLTTLAHARKYWWIASYNDGKGRIFFDDRGFDESVKGYVLGVVVPVMEGNKAIGILKSNINIMETLSQIIEELNENKTEALKLVRSGGLVVFEKGREPLSTKVPGVLVEGMKKWATDSKVIQDNGIDKLFAYAPIHITHGTEKYSFGGSYKSLDHIKGNIGEGWFILISKDLKEVMIASINTIKWIIGIGILFSLLMAVVALFLGKRISLPVIKLAHHASRIGQGDFETKIDVSSEDELGILADSFNKMALNLQQATASRDLLLEEIKQREQALRVSEEMYRKLIGTSPDGIVITTLDGKILNANQAYQDMLGYTLEELKNMNYQRFTPEKWHKTEAEAVKAFLSQTGYGTFEKEYIRKDRTIFPVSLTGWGLKDNQGIPEKIGAFVRDITERKRAEEALRESEERYRSLVETIPYGIEDIDTSGTILFANSAHHKQYGYLEKKLIGKDILDLVPTDSERESLRDYLAFLVNEQPPPTPYFGQKRTKRGKVIDVQVAWDYKRDSEGRVTGFTSVITDITEHKRAEDQIKASLKEKELLLSEIHHRVKNNMQVVSSLLRIQSAKIKDKQYADMFNESHDRIKSMALIHEHLYQSKDFANVDFQGYIMSIVNGLFRSYGIDTNKIALKIESEGISLGIKTAIPCGLLVNELVSNSFKHAFPEDREGEISITLRSINEDELELIVSDDGVGIPEDLDIKNTESLGLELVMILAEDQLEGKVELDRTNGTKYNILLKRQI